MKGIIIYGNPLWGDNAGATYCDFINNASLDLKYIAIGEIEDCLKGEVTESSKATCSKDDTYDFETGALIALMKMCGLEKVVRACNEAFPKERYNTYITKFEGELNDLKKDFDKLGVRNKYLLEDINKKLEYLKEKDEEIEKLKKEKEQIIVAKSILNNKLLEENSQLKYIKSCNESTIESLKNTNETLKKRINELESYNARLEHEVKNVKDALNMCEDKYQDLKAKKVDLVYANYKLKVENEKLKTDCEKLQHGYNDMMFCGGRACGKQYTALVDLFKKIDQKKVDAAYKEAYGSRLIWCTSQSSTRDMLDSLIDSCKYAILTDKDGGQIEKWTGISEFTWEFKVPTKREHMWEKIFKLHKVNDVIIEVKKEDIDTFLHEIENRIPEITWGSGVKIFETKHTIKDVYFELKTHDVIYFRLSRATKLTYTSDPHIYPYRELKIIDYLPPMRWDLFEKGRLVVKVSKENYAEFCSRILSHFDKVGVHAFNHDCKFGYFMFNKDTNYAERLLSSDHGDAKEINRHKVVDWEDVR